MHKDVEQILYTEEELRRRVKELGCQITADYAGRSPMLISVLRGSYIFMADLTRSINLDVTVDFMAVSSYGAGTVSSIVSIPPLSTVNRTTRSSRKRETTVE